jgi:hypothetical protein
VLAPELQSSLYRDTKYEEKEFWSEVIELYVASEIRDIVVSHDREAIA